MDQGVSFPGGERIRICSDITDSQLLRFPVVTLERIKSNPVNYHKNCAALQNGLEGKCAKRQTSEYRTKGPIA
ncbi:hypothetical protein XENTR_v10015659 [Xenopus tropicalis]|nr:hypothetical protein XENTR_v10015659 [Xenopus tropicalis]